MVEPLASRRVMLFLSRAPRHLSHFHLILFARAIVIILGAIASAQDSLFE
jgi:hypothetical protein